MTVFKSDLEYELDYSHKLTKYLECYHLFGNAGQVGATPAVMPDLLGNHDINMTYGTTGGLVGDGALELANHANNVLNTYGLFENFDSAWSGEFSQISRIALFSVELPSVVSTQAWLLDGAGLQIYIAGTTLVVRFLNNSSHYSSVSIPTSTFVSGEILNVAMLLDKTASVGKFVINGVVYPQTHIAGDPFSTSSSSGRPIARSNIGRAASWDDYYGWNGHINFFAIGRYALGEEPTEQDLIDFTTELYPAIKRKQAQIEYCLESDATGSNSVGGYVEFVPLVSSTYNNQVSWDIEFEGANTTYEATWFNKYNSWYLRTHLDGRLQYFIYGQTGVRPAGTVPNPTEFNSYRLECRPTNENGEAHTIEIYVNDIKVHTVYASYGGSLQLKQLMRYQNASNDLRYPCKIKHFKYTDRNNSDNSRRWGFNRTEGTIVLDDLNNSPASLIGYEEGGYVYGYGESDGLQGDGSLTGEFEVWTATGVFDLKFYTTFTNENAEIGIENPNTHTPATQIYTTSNKLYFLVAGVQIVISGMTITKGIEYEISIARDAANLITITLYDEYTDSTVVETGTQAGDVHIGRFARLHKGKFHKQITLNEVGGDNRSYDLTNIVLSKIPETIQGKHAYVKNAPAGMIYSPKDKDKIVGFSGPESTTFHAQTASDNWTSDSSKPFSIKGAFFTNSLVNDNYFFSHSSDADYLYINSGNNRLYLYISGQPILISAVSYIQPNSYYDFEIKRVDTTNFELWLNGELNSVGTDSNSLDVNTLFNYNNTRTAESLCIGTWTFTNDQGDIREYDFTTGDTTSIIDKKSMKHMTINNAPTSGFLPVINKEVFYVGSKPVNPEAMGYVSDGNGGFSGWRSTSSAYANLQTGTLNFPVGETMTLVSTPEAGNPSDNYKLLGRFATTDNILEMYPTAMYWRIQGEFFQFLASNTPYVQPSVGQEFTLEITRDSSGYDVYLNTIFIGRAVTTSEFTTRKVGSIFDDTSTFQYIGILTKYEVTNTWSYDFTQGTATLSDNVGVKGDLILINAPAPLYMDYTDLASAIDVRMNLGADTLQHLNVFDEHSDVYHGDFNHQTTRMLIEGGVEWDGKDRPAQGVKGFLQINDATLFQSDYKDTHLPLVIKDMYFEGTNSAVYTGAKSYLEMDSCHIKSLGTDQYQHAAIFTPNVSGIGSIDIKNSVIDGGLVRALDTYGIVGLDVEIFNSIIRSGAGVAFDGSINNKCNVVNCLIEHTGENTLLGFFHTDMTKLVVNNCVTNFVENDLDSNSSSNPSLISDKGTIYNQPISSWFDGNNQINDEGQTALKFKGFNFSDIVSWAYATGSTVGVNLIQLGSLTVTDVAYCNAPSTLVPVTLNLNSQVVWQP